MGQTGDANKLLKIAGNELRAVVGDDSRFGAGIFYRALAKSEPNDENKPALNTKLRILPSPLK